MNKPHEGDNALLLERLRLGEVSMDTALAASGRSPAELEEKLAELDEDSSRTLSEVPPRVFSAAVSARLSESPGMFAQTLLPLSAALAAALVFAVASGPDERIKGGDGPRLVLLDEDGAAVKPGQVALAGAKFQPVVFTDGRAYASLYSVDGAGVISRYLPRPGFDPAPLDRPRQPYAVPHAIELDDAPQYERFFLLVSDDALPPLTVLRALDGGVLDGGQLPAGVTVVTLQLNKGRP